ncbi:DUF6777 domain-containing protein [Streptomyces griseus]|uniref:DUF6777 domain-containing protein n=1 Tax=Streptomyces griseus TaxID=1911 RepID=UPI00055D8F84|nr:DUF6777 domain-containing protein [Streptomyces griseus]
MPKVASLTAVVVAAAALTVVLVGRSDDKGDTAGSGGGEVFLQNASASGPDPFTASTARAGDASETASLPPRTGTAESATPQVSGSTPGLYGGTQEVASCNVEQQVRYLTAEPAKNTAFASVLGLEPKQVPGYLRSLTPLQLRADTRVTNHGFRDGAATTYQATLQAGTAVLVDGRGVPRVRCACGNPLTGPVAQQRPRTTGTPWPGYSSSQVVAVAPSVTVVNVFVVYDPVQDSWFARKQGDTGRHDRPTPPPPRPTPTTLSPTPTTSSASPSATTTSPVPCVTVSEGQTPTPSGGVTPSPCPSTLSPTPTTSTPTPSAPTTDSSPPASDTPSSETPSAPPSDSPSDSPSDTGTATGATDTSDTTGGATTGGTTGAADPTTGGGTDGRSASASSSSGLSPLGPSVSGSVPGSAPAPGPGRQAVARGTTI